MRRYENPTVEDVRRENIEQFGVGGKRKREDTEDKALTTLLNERATKTQAATPLCDDWLADDILHLSPDELFASCDRAISQHRRPAPPNLALHQGNNSNVQIIDLRGNTGTINLNLGSAPNPVVLE